MINNARIIHENDKLTNQVLLTVLPCFLGPICSMFCLILHKVLACPCGILVDHQFRALSAQQKSLVRLQSSKFDIWILLGNVTRKFGTTHGIPQILFST